MIDQKWQVPGHEKKIEKLNLPVNPLTFTTSLLAEAFFMVREVRYISRQTNAAKFVKVKSTRTNFPFIAQ